MCCGLYNLLIMIVFQSVVVDKVVDLEKDIVFKFIEYYIVQSLFEFFRILVFEIFRVFFVEVLKFRDILRVGWKDRFVKYVFLMVKVCVEKKCKEIFSGKLKDWLILFDMEIFSIFLFGEDGSLYLELLNGL